MVVESSRRCVLAVQMLVGPIHHVDERLYWSCPGKVAAECLGLGRLAALAVCPESEYFSETALTQ